MGFVCRLLLFSLLFSLTLSLVVSMAHAQDHAQNKTPPKQEVAFDHEHDLISLHYDHAPDKDDGHSAAADRTILETKFGTDWIKEHVIPVSGAYGTNRDTFNIKISDANRYLNMKGGDADFLQAAKDHPVFGRVWQAAFDYYDPNERLDFSDTGELMYILGAGEIGIKAFQEQFLLSRNGSK